MVKVRQTKSLERLGKELLCVWSSVVDASGKCFLRAVLCCSSGHVCVVNV